MKRVTLSFLLFLIFNTLGCASIGNNSSYSLQYKRDVLKAYVKYENRNLDIIRSSTTTTADKVEACSRLNDNVADMTTFLPNIYKSDLPFTLTNFYDIRGKDEAMVRNGQPLNIIINKIHLKDNGKTLLFTKGEIAVVVTVDDGKGEKPQSILVAYETGVADNIDLPIASLLAYSTEAYGGEPIRIEITVLGLKGNETQSYKTLLNDAAGIGSTLVPANAAAISVAAQVGNFLLSNRQDDILVKFTFQLYPADQNKTKPSKNFGVPRVALGSYIIFNTQQAGQPESIDDIQVSYDFVPHRLKGTTITRLTESDQGVLARSIVTDIQSACSGTSYQVRPVPWPDAIQGYQQTRMVETYAIFSVDNTAIVDGRRILNRINNINRIAAGFKESDETTLKNVDLTLTRIDDLKSSILLAAALRDFMRNKTNVDSMQLLFDVYPRLQAASDQVALLNEIQKTLPQSKIDGLKGNKDSLAAWYKSNKEKFSYNEESGKYCLKDVGGLVCN